MRKKVCSAVSVLWLITLLSTLACNAQPSTGQEQPMAASPTMLAPAADSTRQPAATISWAAHCPALPPPSGTPETVSPEAALRDRAYNAPAGSTIMVAPGTYNLQDFIHIVNNSISLRGQSGKRGEVVLDFGGMNKGNGHFGILVEADDVTIADLPIRNPSDHGVSIQGRDRPALYNLHIIDTYDQLVKVNPLGDGSEDGLLACSRLEYSTTAPDNYTNGISAHNAHRWIVRDNEWVRIRTATDDPAPTILFWSGSSDTIIERNTLVDCYQGIAFGNASHGPGDHSGGIVRNNFIYSSLPHDVAIEMVHANGWLVAHNTALLLNPAGNLSWGMEARYADSSGAFANNLTNMDILLDRDGAQASGAGNLTNAAAGWFVNAAQGDLHLTADATAAIDQATTLAEAPTDIDGETRPMGDAPDVGADEYHDIELEARAYLPMVTSTPAPAGPLPTNVIQAAELVYQGAFRLPDYPDGMGWAYGGAALAYYPAGDPHGPADNYPGSLFATGHEWYQHVSEIIIPLRIISAYKNPAELNSATTLQDFSDIRGDLFDRRDFEQPRVGLAYLPAQNGQSAGKLYFAWGQHMQETDTGPTHGWSELDLSNPQSAGAWRLDAYWNYITNDYILEIPRAWAEAYVPGNYLASGRFRDGGQGAMGPSLLAYGPWNHGNPPAPGATLSATPLLMYGNAYQENPVTLNNYHHADEWSGATWLTAGDRSAVVFVGTKGQGECWYGFANGVVWPQEPPYPPVPPAPYDDRGWWSTSFVGQMLFYDPAELAAVVQGELEPHAPQPYATLDIDHLLYGIESSQQKYHLGAASFDAERGLLYLFESFGDGDKPLIHVWQISN